MLKAAWRYGMGVRLPGLLPQLAVRYKAIEPYSWSQSGAEFQTAWSYTSTVSPAFSEHNSSPVKTKQIKPVSTMRIVFGGLWHIKCTDGSKLLDSVKEWVILSKRRYSTELHSITTALVVFKFYVVRTMHSGMKLYNDQRNAQVFNLSVYSLQPYVFRGFF
jgi:hypothetical protein